MEQASDAMAMRLVRAGRMGWEAGGGMGGGPIGAGATTPTRRGAAGADTVMAV